MWRKWWYFRPPVTFSPSADSIALPVQVQTPFLRSLLQVGRVVLHREGDSAQGGEEKLLAL